MASLTLLRVSLKLLSLVQPQGLHAPARIFPTVTTGLYTFLLIAIIKLSNFSGVSLRRTLSFKFSH